MIAVGDATWIALSAMALGFGLLTLVGVAMIRNRDIRAKLGTMEVVLGAVHGAVNDQPKNAPTLSKQVNIIADQLSGVVAKLDSLFEQIANRDKLVDARLDALDVRVTDVDGRVRELTAHVFTNPGLPTP